jgi:hypothetical protein
MLREWEENAWLRWVVKRYGNYEYVGSPATDVEMFGFNTLDAKDIYVEDSDIAAHFRGEEYGRALAEGENDRILARIIGCVRRADRVSGTDEVLVQRIATELENLRHGKYRPVVLILNSWSAAMALEQHGGLIWTQAGAAKLAMGDFRQTPVFNVRYSGKPMVVLVDLKKLGRWRQRRPPQELKGEQYLGDEFSFYINAYTREAALDLVRKQPNFRKDRDGNERPEDEVVRELQQRVHLKIVEQFEFAILDRNAGYTIPVKSDFPTN